MQLRAQSLEDFGLDAPKHNGKLHRLCADGVPDRIPIGKELEMLNRKCDKFLRSRGIHQTTKAEWMFPNSKKRKLTKKLKSQLIESDYETDRFGQSS